MTLVVRSNGKPVRAYDANGHRVMVSSDGRVDPIKLALANLRRDIKADRSRLMSDFRQHVERRTDVFGLREQTRVAQANAWRAEFEARAAERRAQAPTPAEPAPAPAPLTKEAKLAKVRRAWSILGAAS